ncbi:hypothetical protein RN001_007841 [Aquatica leii]|uniref:acid phosphatase n=1 Tax=Aquatica leii TaxID=1421715 RepID=A0AAN7Q4N1_9COLE|nr:hypothetical protein RN001_007841 [Aquatica leii]
MYPKDPYRNETYYPYGYGELTNTGKLRMYKLGEVFRKQFKSFLGSLYLPGLIKSVSTDYSRTKCSLQLFLAGLFPPFKTLLEWNNNLNWNPIAFDTVSLQSNRLLSFPYFFCPRYQVLYRAYTQTPEVVAIENHYKPMYSYVTQNTGLNVTSIFQLFGLYFGLTNEKEWGLTLPAWTNAVFPNYLRRAAEDNYVVMSGTPQLNQLFGEKVINSTSENESLRMVAALFRHGHRTREVYGYPTDPYNNETFEPYGAGQLTSEGKLLEYNLGRMLRKRYNKFLGPTYKSEDVYAVSTNYSRTECSLQLVLAGLFPPKNTELQWHQILNWNPIPYDLLYPNNNRLISVPFLYCPRFLKELAKFFRTSRGRAIENKYAHKYPYLSKHTGMNVTSIFSLLFLYDALKSESDWGLTLPIWTKSIYPEYLHNGSVDNFVSFSANPQLIQLGGGFLLEKIIDDMFTAIEGKGPKLYLYSAHDLTVANLLSAMNVFFPHTPPYGACVIVELHNKHDSYFVKIFYQDYTPGENFKQLVIPRCHANCPIKKFIDLLKGNIAKGDTDPCESEPHGQRTREKSTYPNDPYANEQFKPYGIGELITKGKMTEYNLGKMLRNRYNSFLGPVYKPQDVSAYTSNFSRTKCSLQLVLAGLFPPQNTELQWNEHLNWNPISYETLLPEKSHLLSIPLANCPRYIVELAEYFKTEKVKNMQRKYDYQYQFLSENTGLNITSFFDLYFLYDTLVTENDWNLTLPEWTKSVYPEYLKNATVDNLLVWYGTPTLKQLSGGFLLKKIINDMIATITSKGPKIYLYSAHDLTVASLLSAMNVNFPHVPYYGSCVIVELHSIKGKYFVKIFYHTSEESLKSLVVPECTVDCPIKQFAELLKDNMPDDRSDPCSIKE